MITVCTVCNGLLYELGDSWGSSTGVLLLGHEKRLWLDSIVFFFSLLYTHALCVQPQMRILHSPLGDLHAGINRSQQPELSHSWLPFPVPGTWAPPILWRDTQITKSPTVGPEPGGLCCQSRFTRYGGVQYLYSSRNHSWSS